MKSSRMHWREQRKYEWEIKRYVGKNEKIQWMVGIQEEKNWENWEGIISDYAIKLKT